MKMVGIILLGIIFFGLCLAASWSINAVTIWLICKLLSVRFSLKITTAIWFAELVIAGCIKSAR